MIEFGSFSLLTRTDTIKLRIRARVCCRGRGAPPVGGRIEATTYREHTNAIARLGKNDTKDVIYLA